DCLVAAARSCDDLVAPRIGVSGEIEALAAEGDLILAGDVGVTTQVMVAHVGHVRDDRVRREE
ncbi:MAG: hypothetical protein ABJA33_12935, partial [Pedococcus sp.]